MLLVIFAVTWRWERVGAVLFSALEQFYLAPAWGWFHWWVYLTICGPLLLVRGLFLMNWVYRNDLRHSRA